MKKIALLLICAVASVAAHAQLLWRVTGPGLDRPTYILGSHHVAPPTMIDSVPGLRHAIADVDAVYGEVEKSGLTGVEAQQQMMAKVVAPADSTLDKVLTPEQMGLLDKTLAQYFGMPGLAAQMKGMKPAVISSQLAVMQAAKAFPGFDPQNVFDVAVMALGESLGKPINGFETLDQQLDLLYGTPIAEQAEDLMKAITEEEKMIKYSIELAEAYQRQDLDAIHALFTSPDADMSPAAFERLVTARNANWVVALKQLMPAQSLLVVVGAGHLPGDEGVLNLLKSSGFTVAPVTQ